MPLHNISPNQRAIFAAILSACAISVAVAAPNDGASYMEAVGQKVAVDLDPVRDTGTDSNPLLNPNAPAPVAGQGGGVQPGLYTDGDVSHSSNVPRPGQPGQVAATGQNPSQQRTQQVVQRDARYQQQQRPTGAGQGGSIEATPLPNPAIDPKMGEFQQILEQMGNVTPEQIRAFKEYQWRLQAATLAPMNPGTIGRASQYVVDLSPGASPPVVRVSRGLGATVNFVDSAGNPWPIKFANNFYAEAASVTQMTEHVLSVSARSDHLTGSVGVILEGLTTPINFIVTPAQESTDYRVDLHIPGLSPNAPPVPGAVSARPGLATGKLMDFLYGATPDGATRLKVAGATAVQGNTRAWQNSNGQLILRTSAQVISPGWYERLPAMDGTSVYALPSSSVVRVSVDGKEDTFTIEGLTPRGTKKSPELAAK